MATYDAEDIAWFEVDVAFAPRFDVDDVFGAAAVYPKVLGVSPVPAAYRKDSLGEVHLKGHIKGGTLGAQAFTLFPGYRPAEDLVFEVHSETDTASVIGAVRVLANGAVIPSIGGNALVSLDGISFRAA